MVNIDVRSICNGLGIDTSMRKSKRISNAKFTPGVYNNLYTLYPDVEFESLDFVYNENSINKTKFSIVLLTEWVKYLKVGGSLVVVFNSNKLLNGKRMHRIFEQFLSKNMKLVHEENNDDEWLFVFEKKKPRLIDSDSLDKWTFGIITVGKRNEWVRQFIESVRDQKIPHYEIIIVGTWNDDSVNKQDIKYIHFNKQDDKGWITKKKNIIFQHAKYNNVLVLHDRFFLDKNWYKGMQQYGNYWDGLFFPIIDKTGYEYVHWSVWGHGFLPIGYADIKDWDEDYYAGGTFMAIKKNIWKKVKLNEKLFWADQEDAEYGLRFTKAGYLMRPNKSAKLHTAVTYLYDAPVYQYDAKKLGKPIEHRSRKWIIIQPIVDILTRTLGVPFLRLRRKLSLFLKKYIKVVAAPESGGKRE